MANLAGEVRCGWLILDGWFNTIAVPDDGLQGMLLTLGGCMILKVTLWHDTCIVTTVSALHDLPKEGTVFKTPRILH